MNSKWRMQEFFNNIRVYFDIKRENRTLKNQAFGEDKESRIIWMLIIVLLISQAFWGIIFIKTGLGERFKEMRDAEKNISISLDNISDMFGIAKSNKKTLENIITRLNLLSEIEEQNARPPIMDIF